MEDMIDHVDSATKVKTRVLLGLHINGSLQGNVRLVHGKVSNGGTPVTESRIWLSVQKYTQSKCPCLDYRRSNRIQAQFAAALRRYCLCHADNQDHMTSL
jgi:hypothetical protein